MVGEGTHTIKKAEVAAFAEALIHEYLVPSADGATVVALHGDLGAGKTTLVQSIGAALGITEPLTSPTFTIMKQYELSSGPFLTLSHMDAYRIDDMSELRPLRFAELLAVPQTLICIEWAEKIADALPPGVVHLTLSIIDEETRTVHIART